MSAKEWDHSSYPVYNCLYQCLVGTEITLIKQNFKTSFYIECIKHKLQLKINFLVGNHNMNQYLSFVACVFSVSLCYVG